MLKPTANMFMYSGQGSQYYNMGYSLYQNNPVFREYMIQLDKIVQEIAGFSVLGELFDERKSVNDDFDNLMITHPAIFMVQYAMTQTIMSKDILPDAVFGYSLGEICALVVAGALDVESALRFIIKQAETVMKFCAPGIMYSVIADAKAVELIKSSLPEFEVAANNFDEHFVVSGPVMAENKLVDQLFNSSIPHYKLPIRFAFHSRDINPAMDKIKQLIAELSFSPLQIPMLSCTTGEWIHQVSHDHLQQLIRSKIYCQEAFKQIEPDNGFSLIDVGPSDTLANFARYNEVNDAQGKIIATLRPSKLQYGDDDLRGDLLQISA